MPLLKAKKQVTEIKEEKKNKKHYYPNIEIETEEIRAELKALENR